MRTRIQAGFLAVLFACAPTVARADDPVVDDTAPLFWFTGVTEIGLGATMVVLGAGDVCEGWGCGLLVLLAGGASVVAGLIAAGVAAATDAPADFPFVVHSTAMGALEAVLVTASISELALEEDPDRVVFGLSAAIVGVGQGTYSFLRRDEILRSPDLLGWGHLMAWAPGGAALLVALLADELGADSSVSALLAGIAALAVYGISVAGIETTLAR